MSPSGRERPNGKVRMLEDLWVGTSLVLFDCHDFMSAFPRRSGERISKRLTEVSVCSNSMASRQFVVSCSSL